MASGNTVQDHRPTTRQSPTKGIEKSRKPPKLQLRTMSADTESRTQFLFKTLTEMKTTTDLISTSRSRTRDKSSHNTRGKGFLLTEISAADGTSRSFERPKIEDAKSQVKQYRSSPTRYVFSKAPHPRHHSSKSADEIEIFRDLHRRYRVVRGEERNLHDAYSSLLRGPTRICKTAYDYNTNYF